MKSVIFCLSFLFLSFFSKAQFPNQTPQGNSLTEVYWKGGSGVDTGFHFRSSFTDTSTANLGFIKNIPGFVIRVRDTLFMRNNLATAWLHVSNNSSITGATNGTAIQGGLVVLGTNPLIQNTTLGTRSFNFKLEDNPDSANLLINSTPPLKGTNNVFLGNNILSSGIGYNNTAVGNKALKYGDTLSFNSAFGQESMLYANSSYSTSFGARSGQFSQRDSNVSVGYRAGHGYGKGNTAIGANAQTANEVLTSTLANTNVIQGTTTFSGANTATFISGASLSVGDTAIFLAAFATAPGAQQNPLKALGVITNSNTISFLKQDNFPVGTYGAITFTVFDKQNYSIAIGYNAKTTNSHQLAVSPNIDTLYVPGMATGANYVLTDVAGNGKLTLKTSSSLGQNIMNANLTQDVDHTQTVNFMQRWSTDGGVLGTIFEVDPVFSQVLLGKPFGISGTWGLITNPSTETLNSSGGTVFSVGIGTDGEGYYFGSLLNSDASKFLTTNTEGQLILTTPSVTGFWSLATGGTLTGTNTITSNVANRLNWAGAFTATAQGQFYDRQNPSLTLRGTVGDTLYNKVLAPTFTQGANTQYRVNLALLQADNPGAFSGGQLISLLVDRDIMPIAVNQSNFGTVTKYFGSGYTANEYSDNIKFLNNNYLAFKNSGSVDVMRLMGSSSGTSLQLATFGHFDAVSNGYLLDVKGSAKILADETIAAAGNPAAPSVANVGTTGATTYTYKIVGRTTSGSVSAASSATSTTTGNATLTGSNYNSITWTEIVGYDFYDIYRTAGGATQGKIGSLTVGSFTTFAFNDVGSAGDGLTAPTINTTGNLLMSAYGTGLHTGTQTYTLGVDASGNVIESTALSGFVPYTGATSDVDLGSHNLTTLGHLAGNHWSASGQRFELFDVSGTNLFRLDNTSGFRLTFDASVLSSVRTVTFQDADGTVAYLSNINAGTVTSVGFTGGLISVGNPTTTPAFTVAGTSGGIVYFNSTSTWASSNVLASGALVIGAGAGGAPTTTTTGTGVLTALGINTSSAGGLVLFNGAGGTPSSLTGTNITGTASGLTAGNVTTNANLTGAITSVGNASSLGSFSSANLLGALTDEVGTGKSVFNINPNFTGITLDDASNIVLNTTTGTKIGTGTTQKLGFYNATPVAQQTGSVITGLNNLGLFTGATITASDVTLANLTATDATLTFSGTYNGSTARTIGINLSNANTWAAIQTFSTPVINGLATGTGVASAATASTIVTRDANANININNNNLGYTTTATAAGTTTLTVSSTALQYFTGSTTQTVVLPVASTLVLGQRYIIVNNSSGVVTVNSSGSNAVMVLAASTATTITCILTSGTDAASWSTTIGLVSSVSNADGSITITPTTGAVVATLNVANGNQWSANTTFSRAITTSTLSGITLRAGSAATVGTPVRWSPSTVYRTRVWNTGGTPANNDDDFIVEAVGVSGNPTTATLNFSHSLNGAANTLDMQLSSSGNLIVGATNNIQGTATNNNAVAGNIGEEINSTISTYTNYTTTATYQNVTSIALTAGDWDISAFGTLSSNAATITLAANAIFVISTTTASAAGATEGQNIAYIPQAALVGTSKESLGITPYRISLSGNTTYYLNTQATFTIGNPQFVGSIRARRIR